MKTKNAFTMWETYAGSIGFTVGYVIAVLIEGTFGWHSYLAGAAGNVIGYYAIHHLSP